MPRLALPIPPEMEPAVLALNNEHAVELSWLEPGRLHVLIGRAFHARRIGDLSAFLLAFDERADYDNPNYLWFRARYPRFVYVDRIISPCDCRRLSRRTSSGSAGTREARRRRIAGRCRPIGGRRARPRSRRWHGPG